jgi:serine/threonine-protein kinase
MSVPFSPADRLDQAVAEYLAAVESGSTPDRDEFVARYSDVSAELKQFLADHQRMAGLVRPVRCVLASAWGQPPDGNSPWPIGGDDPTIGLVGPGDYTQQSLSGRRIGDYEIVRELGRGGMGVVYQARHVQLNRTVALKMVLAGQFAAAHELERFREEARAAAALDHPGIVSIYEVGHVQGQPFFSMAYVEGPSLARVLQRGPLPPLLAARLFRKLLVAVSFAHSHGVIHRDLKPANVLLAHADPRGGDLLAALEACEPKITDFGLAKRLDGDSRLTASGQLLGTPSYMSPEQAAGRIHEAGPPADIYSLGAILYSMLTARPPFTSDNPVEIILQVLESEPTLPRQIRPEIPRELEWICLKCLEKQPADRYATVADLIDDVDRFLRHEPVEARSPTLGQRLRRWMRRQPALAWHVIGLGLVLALVQFFFVLHPGRELVYHLEVSGVLVLWIAFSLAFQWLMDREREPGWSHYFWGATDAVLLTALLALLEGPLGLLLGSYLVLICGSGLFFQTRLVAVTTLAAMMSFAGLLALRPAEAHPWHYALLFEASLVIAGLVVGYQVWRLSVLREYYDDRRGR